MWNWALPTIVDRLLIEFFFSFPVADWPAQFSLFPRSQQGKCPRAIDRYLFSFSHRTKCVCMGESFSSLSLSACTLFNVPNLFVRSLFGGRGPGRAFRTMGTKKISIGQWEGGQLGTFSLSNESGFPVSLSLTKRTMTTRKSHARGVDSTIVLLRGVSKDGPRTKMG